MPAAAAAVNVVCSHAVHHVVARMNAAAACTSAACLWPAHLILHSQPLPDSCLLDSTCGMQLWVRGDERVPGAHALHPVGRLHRRRGQVRMGCMQRGNQEMLDPSC